MHYVIPAIISSEKISAEREVSTIYEVERERGEELRAIAPFYYPLYVRSFSYSYSYIVDPRLSSVFKFEYRVPDTSYMLERLSEISSRELNLKLLKNFYELLSERYNPKHWPSYSVLCARTIHGRHLLDRVSSLLSYVSLERVLGIVLEPADVSSVIENNDASLKSFFARVGGACVDVDRMKRELAEIRNKWKVFVDRKLEESLERLRSLCRSIDEMASFSIEEINRRLSEEISSVINQYSPIIDSLKAELNAIDRNVEKIKRELAQLSGDLRRKYKKLLNKLLARRKLVLGRIGDLEEELNEKIEGIKRRHELVKSVERARKGPLLKEQRRLSAEHSRLVNVLDLYFNRIVNRLDRACSVLENYRDSLVGHLFVSAPGLNECYVYVKGYVVLGSRGLRVYTTSYLVRDGSKLRIVPDELVKRLLSASGVLQALERADPELVREHDLLNK